MRSAASIGVAHRAFGGFQIDDDAALHAERALMADADDAARHGCGRGALIRRGSGSSFGDDADDLAGADVDDRERRALVRRNARMRGVCGRRSRSCVASHPFAHLLRAARAASRPAPRSGAPSFGRVRADRSTGYRVSRIRCRARVGEPLHGLRRRRLPAVARWTPLVSLRFQRRSPISDAGADARLQFGRLFDQRDESSPRRLAFRRRRAADRRSADRASFRSACRLRR